MFSVTIYEANAVPLQPLQYTLYCSALQIGTAFRLCLFNAA